MPKGTVLAFDFGLKRIGVAVGELELGMAHPLATLSGTDPVQTIAAIDKLVKEWRPNLLIVGQPRHNDGRPHALSGAIEKFVASLKNHTGLEVALSDESYSSAAASMALRDAGVSGQKQKAMLDSVAAQEILQGYFENHGITAR
jgi:putative holliday junction resolvase